jgi:hypothetical protein
MGFTLDKDFKVWEVAYEYQASCFFFWFFVWNLEILNLSKYGPLILIKAIEE